MQLFSADTTLFSKRIYIYVLPLKTCSKVAYNLPNFFFSTPLSCPYRQKLKIHIGNWAEAPSVIFTL